MAELAHFKNFAKLKDTSVEFNDITVLAGKPGTGKSYVMKYFYAVSESFHRKTTDTLFLELIENHQQYLSYIASILLEEKAFKEAKILIMNNNFDEYKKLFKDELNIRIKDELNIRIKEIKSYKELKLNDKMGLFLSNILKSIFIEYNQISDNFIIDTNNLELSNIETNLEFKFKDLLSKNNETVVFVETPLILEFKKFMPKEKGKTPYHIESLLNILDTDYSFTDKEQDKLIKSFREKSQAIIGGDIESSGDSFIFNRKDDKNYDILNASSGIKSIGLLQYLVTNKALKKGSVLFWEEPEVHLHPQWQLKMVDLFVELMNAGVKIVFSTHSPYMADYLNAISKKGDYRDRVSFNVLDEKDGVVSNHILDDDNWDILQKELMDTFEDILWQYL